MLPTSRYSCILTLAVAAVLPLASLAPAAVILNDEASGQLVDAAPWGGTAPAAGDTLNIDAFTISTSVANGSLVPDDLIINLSGAGKLAFSYDANLASTVSATINLPGGGTIEHSRGSLFAGGLTMNVSGTSTYFVNAANEISSIGGSASAQASTILTGSGTILKTGAGSLSIRSIDNALDTDGATPGNQTRTNASTFNGLFDVQAGILEVGMPEIVKFATVNLGGTVAGTITGYSSPATSAQLDDAPRLNYAAGGTYSGTQLEVKNLTGTGRVSWNNTTGYYRDIAVGTLIDPGSAGQAGLIKRNTSAGSNDLVMRPGSTMAFDVLGPNAADADQVDWTSTTGLSGMVFNEANLLVRLFEPADSTGVLNWILINGDEWISKTTQGSSVATAIPDQAFASIAFQDAAGNPLNLYTGPADTDGGWDLGYTTGYGISYTGTSGSSNRQVVLTGQYVSTVPVPEPASLTVLGIGAIAFLARRRK